MMGTSAIGYLQTVYANPYNTTRSRTGPQMEQRHGASRKGHRV